MAFLCKIISVVSGSGYLGIICLLTIIQVHKFLSSSFPLPNQYDYRLLLVVWQQDDFQFLQKVNAETQLNLEMKRHTGKV